MKIIPAIDLMDGKVVRLYKGDPKNKTIYSDNPVEIAKKWESLGGDILHIVDLDATLGSGENFKTIKEICLKVEKDTGDTVSPANINSIKQVVIAGTDSAASIAAEECLSNGAKRAIKLNVSVASHCELMRSASESLAKELTD